MGRSFVTCSGLQHHKKTLRPFPGFGIYLAYQWENVLSPYWTNGAYVKRVAERRAYPALIVDVFDMSAPASDVLDNLVEICVSKMKQGKLVDIGCYAGHGRTGLLLACLIARKERLSARDAIKATRVRYCSRAIETLGQELAVERYVERLNSGRLK